MKTHLYSKSYSQGGLAAHHNFTKRGDISEVDFTVLIAICLFKKRFRRQNFNKRGDIGEGNFTVLIAITQDRGSCDLADSCSHD